MKKGKLVDSENLKLPEECCRWYAACTRANHEKRVSKQLSVSGVEHFLPLCATVRRWKDWRKNLEIPLFPGYVFLRMVASRTLAGASNIGCGMLVDFDGRPAALPAHEIETLHSKLLGNVEVRPHPYLAVETE
jgi:transcription antitermination factor NusG